MISQRFFTQSFHKTRKFDNKKHNFTKLKPSYFTNVTYGPKHFQTILGNELNIFVSTAFSRRSRSIACMRFTPYHPANLRFVIDATAHTIPSCIVGKHWAQPGVSAKVKSKITWIFQRPSYEKDGSSQSAVDGQLKCSKPNRWNQLN